MSLAPYGTWASPLSSADVAAGSTRLDLPRFASGHLYWIEMRPAESGRHVVVRLEDTEVVDVVPEGFNARSAVHEYGGGSYTVDENGTVFFVNWDDQRIYRRARGSDPEPITPEPPAPRAWRYADLQTVPGTDVVIAVRERHGAEVENDLVRIEPGEDPVAVAGGYDFYASPRVSPSGDQMAWLSWNQPDMPWDATELWVADLDDNLDPTARHRIAGGLDESVVQPEFDDHDNLWWMSDRTGYWNLYREGRPVAPIAADCAGPTWTFGRVFYVILDDGSTVMTVTEEGFERLYRLESSGSRTPIEVPRGTHRGRLATDGRRLAVISGAVDELDAVRIIGDGDTRTIRRSEQPIDPAYVSPAKPITFPSDDGPTHAFFYAPRNPEFEAPEDEKPPLVVFSHGGPTSAARPDLNLTIQFWTTRGFAVVDVNYAGSTGYGRAYRQRLRTMWGIADTRDCVSAARYLAGRALVDPDRMVIRGGSAGGYTTLAALTFHDVFKAGASYYGVSDLEALAEHTHKFEARYLDRLVGPYPEARSVYYERSPIHFADRISCPIIFFQGLEDVVVPPEQAESMIAAMKANGLRYEYVPFEGEQHGFRRAENIATALDRELAFYGSVFEFEPA